MLDPPELAERYNATFGKRYPGSILRVSGNAIQGVWVLGNNYRGSGYYGAFPPNYLPRVMAMFPPGLRVLHVFSGSLPPGDYVRVDLNDRADVVANAEELDRVFPPASFDLVVADPPYSKEHARRYGFKMPDRRKVLVALSAILAPGGYVSWLDTVWPMSRRDRLALAGSIGVLRSQNHAVRFSFLLRKPAASS